MFNVYSQGGSVKNLFYYFIIFLLLIFSSNFYAMRYVCPEKRNGEANVLQLNIMTQEGPVLGEFVPRRVEMDNYMVEIQKIKVMIRFYKSFIPSKREIGELSLVADSKCLRIPFFSIFEKKESVAEVMKKLGCIYDIGYNQFSDKRTLLRVLKNLELARIFVLKNELVPEQNSVFNKRDIEQIEGQYFTRCFSYYKREDFLKEELLDVVNRVYKEIVHMYCQLVRKEQLVNQYERLSLICKVVKRYVKKKLMCEFSVD